MINYCILTEPIANVTIGSNKWFQHDEPCKLSIKFSGTGPFQFCKVMIANRNISDIISNTTEDCSKFEVIDSTSIDFIHFFPKTSNTYTVIFFIKNEVSETKTPVGVNYYKG